MTRWEFAKGEGGYVTLEKRLIEKPELKKRELIRG